ncbi:MAG: YggS family pyridoxal phosphate-dependent enzyme [Bacteroidia bacterium]|nr:YggS family pyridoxal phosphate-dependent enzyme [Bacteroidia bacterium]
MSVTTQITQLKTNLPPQVTLVAVSKTKPVELLQEAYNAGQRVFGENYIQEIVAKQPLMPNDVVWHFIGHLQTNKVKYIAPFIHTIQSVDSEKLLTEINKQAQKYKRVITVFLQLHIAQEETKFGLSYAETAILLAKLNEYPHVHIAGLMAMGSNTDNQTQLRNEFAELHTFYKQYPNLPHLCVGMSADYELAIEYGSTMVRLGSSIFGSRQII